MPISHSAHFSPKSLIFALVQGLSRQGWKVRNLSTGGQASNAFAQTSSLNIIQREFYSLEGGSEQPNSYKKATSTGDLFLPKPYAYVTSGSRTLGSKVYELKDHLGNVRATLSDVRMSTITPTGIGDFHPDVLSMTDYYAFGMIMIGRNWSADSYRYGFNGKENDNEVQGVGNQQDYGMRVYDPRLAKFLSVDPLAPEFPWNSNYAFAEDDVIRCVDLDGAEKLIYHIVMDENTCKSKIGKVTTESGGWTDYITGYHYFVKLGNQPAVYLTDEVDWLNGGMGSKMVSKFIGLNQEELETALGQRTDINIAEREYREQRDAAITQEWIDMMAGVYAAGRAGTSKPAVNAEAAKLAKAQRLAEKAEKLNSKDRSGQDFTAEGKAVVIELNKLKNGGYTKCENCGTVTIPSKKSQSGVTPPKNETQVDHIHSKSNGGSGTPNNGQVLCRDCNRKKSNK